MRHSGCFPHPSGPWEACWAPVPGSLFSGAPSGLVGPGDVGESEEGGRGGKAEVGEPSRTNASGEAWWVFPPHIQPQEAHWASGSGPLLSRAPSGHMGPRGMVRGRRREDNGEGPSEIRGSGGNMPSISPAHSGPVSLLGT